MPEPSPFDADRMRAAFAAAATPADALRRLELLGEQARRRGRAGALPDGEAAALERRVHLEAARAVPALDAPLLAALLLGAADAVGPASPVLARPELRARVRETAPAVYPRLLDAIEAAEGWRRADLWSAVEALARVAPMPEPVRERVWGWLHTLPREIVPDYPEAGVTLRRFRRPAPRALDPAAQRALEAAAAARALLADRELPPDQLAALAPRALETGDPVMRRQLAEHPRADVRSWRALLQAARPEDRALPGRVSAAWADPELAARLRALGDEADLAPDRRAAVLLHLCRGAPAAVARAWVPELARRGGFAALALLAQRPELGAGLGDAELAPLLRDTEVRTALGLEERTGDPTVAAFAAETARELMEAPGAALVRRLRALALDEG